MSLAPQTRLGPYVIEAPLGAGGMGEVYKARDTRLDRTVAIKVLPAELAFDPDRRQRLDREARAVAALTHPHICTLHDVGHQDGIDFLVMEYLEGETLAERLTKGALPLDQVLRHAIDIADALDKAHRLGMVHRDVKPANIMLTSAGAKLLDFGVAKLRIGDAANLGLSAAPTEEGLTAEGTILGTLHYMAPEQLEGKTVDARSDLFAFGAVIHEMATGQKAFSGKSRASVIAAILDQDPPPVSTLKALSPPALDHVVSGCLAKNPEDRWLSAHDVMLELKWIQRLTKERDEVDQRVGRGTTRRERLAWAGICTMLLAGLVGLWRWRVSSGETVSPAAIQFAISPPEGSSFAKDIPIVSPDGRRLAFVVVDRSGERTLYRRELDSPEATLLPGTEGATEPFWSPDNRFIGFFAEGKLKKIDIAGGRPQIVCDAVENRGGTWNSDGIIVFAAELSGPLYRVSASGGPVTPVTKLEVSRQENSHRWPQFLPGGRHFVFVARSGRPENTGIYVGSLDAAGKTRLIGAYSRPMFVAAPPNGAGAGSPGLLAYVRDGTLMTVSFDPRRLVVLGEPLAVSDGVGYEAETGDAYVSVSAADVLTYRTGETGNLGLAWFDREGKALGAVSYPPRSSEFGLSPDGRRATLNRTNPDTGTPDIWLIELSRGTVSRVTHDPAGDYRPRFSPDGNRLAFSTNRRGSSLDIYVANLETGGEELLFESDIEKWVTDWSSDGALILFENIHPKTRSDLWAVSVADQKATPLLQTPFSEQTGRLSPDRRWLAYVSDESGRPEVYVRPFGGSGRSWQISSTGGDEPEWRLDGEELFYISPDKKLMVVPLETRPSTLVPGAARELFDVPFHDPSFVRTHYSVTPDGQRFLVITPAARETPPSIVVKAGWRPLLQHIVTPSP